VTCLSRGLEVDVRAANFRRYSRPYTDILQNLFLDDAPMFTPLLDALSAGHTDVADLLFSRGADAKAMAAFEEERMKTHCIAFPIFFLLSHLLRFTMPPLKSLLNAERRQAESSKCSSSMKSTSMRGAEADALRSFLLSTTSL